MSQLLSSVQNIVTSKAGKSQKIKALKALNITDYEISLLLSAMPKVERAAAKKLAITFGVEIETFGFTREALLAQAAANGLNAQYQGYNHRDSNTVYKFVTDGSVTDNDGNRYGTCIECVTPVLKGTKTGYKSLENCCNTLNACGAQINKSCGLHVHIGAAALTDEQYVSVFVNYQHLESVIDSFMAKSRRGEGARWCAGIKRFNFESCHTKLDVYRAMGGNRYHKVNPVAYTSHKTIEFRQHQGSTDYEKISHWVRFCAALVVWSCDNRMTDDITSIDEIPFLAKADKEYYKSRKEQLA